MVKPRAARKQPIVLSSDSEEDASRPPPSKRPKRSLLTAQNDLTQNEDKPTRAPSKSTAPAKPSKAAHKKSPTKSPSKPKPVYKSITSFFSNVPQPQVNQRAPSPDKQSTPHEDIEDIFDSSDDDSLVKPQTALPVRNQAKTGSGGGNQNGARGRQQFLRIAPGSQGTSVSSQGKPKDVEDRRPWTDKYGPSSLEELAVHKKKVADVRTWLSDVVGGRDRKRLLILKGPAGSGKTTTVALLSKELSIDIQEWKNPTSSMSTSDGLVSATAQFEDFVGRTGTFGSLSFDVAASSQQPNPPSSQVGKRKQLVLVEEYPNTFTRASSAVQSFRSSVLNYLAANTQSATVFFSSQPNPDTSVTPIVMIISETLLSTNTAAADSFTAHRLLGPEILTHPGVTVIEFNPIAPTFMTKALETIVVKEARKSGRRKTLGPQVIQRLADLGDIRSAVSSLEFLCLRGDDAEGWGAKVNFSKKKGPKDVPITKMEQESLELITQRESTLGIFHSVGRVVHNKRVPENPDLPVPHPPNWFPERRRPKASEVNVNTLIDELGTDTQTFVAALHENYVLSCGGADSEETMDSIEGCIDGLSDADLLSPDRFGAGAGRRNLQGTSADNLRQDEMCFQTGVRGILYNLPNPVKRMAPPPGVMGVKPRGQGSGAPASKGNAFVMYYPASLRLWRQQEETEGLLEMWISRAQRGELLASLQGTTKAASAPSGIDTWRTKSFAQPASTQKDDQSSGENNPPTVLLGSGGSARYEMLLERLPYLAIVLRKARNPAPATAATVREIRKITSFTGESISRTEDDDDDLYDRAQGDHEQWTTDKPTPETPRRKKSKFGVKELEPQSSIPGLVEKSTSLALSDDDIED